MLEPGNRTTLAELLRAPEGYRVDRVVATTFSLDLVALLTLPLTMAMGVGEAVDADGRADPLALIEGLRAFADRMHVFHEPGQVAVPRRGLALMGYLERALVETRAPRGGVFHPKVTIVRFVPTDPGGDATGVRYRLTCGTRNLTFDRSWDTALSLDGTLASQRTRAIARNRPLSRFIGRLPELAMRAVAPQTAEAVAMVAEELLRVHFEVPDGFGADAESLAFWPVGIDDAATWPFSGRTDRMLIVSPFIDRTGLARFRKQTALHTLISRPEELDVTVDASEGEETSCYVLLEAADGDAQESDSTSDDVPAPESDERIAVEASAPSLSGLHAKLFVADAGTEARVWTGSANATGAAFSRNVEFLVELRGRRSVVGIDALMRTESSDNGKPPRPTFRSLLRRYQKREIAKPVDPVERALDDLLDQGRRLLVDARLSARVEAVPEKVDIFTVTLEAALPPADWPAAVSCKIRPISLPPADAVDVTGLATPLPTFAGLPFQYLTGFCAVDLEATYEGRHKACAFVVLTPLVGAPADREQRLLLAVLSSRAKVLRYLLLLLDGPEALLMGEDGTGRGSWTPARSGVRGEWLLEAVLRRLADDPLRLRIMGRLICDLETTDYGVELLPNQLRELWASIHPLLLADDVEEGTR